MPIDIPSLYLTRPNAAKQFKRSQRQLERDLEEAYKSADENVLDYYKLVTSDGAVRNAREVTTSLVKKLQSDGLVPTWIVEIAYLEKRFGRRGETQNDSEPQKNEPGASANTVTRTPANTKSNVLPDDIPFLKSRIRQLEDEKDKVERDREADRKRHDGTVERLFAEIDVKNQQISAWDEVAQSLTKGLATGMIKPDPTAQALLAMPSNTSNAEVAGTQVVDNLVRNSGNSDAEPEPSITVESANKQGNPQKPKPRKKSRGSKSRKRKSSKVLGNKKTVGTSTRKSSQAKARPRKPKKKQHGFLRKHLPTFFANKK